MGAVAAEATQLAMNRIGGHFIRDAALLSIATTAVTNAVSDHGPALVKSAFNLVTAPVKWAYRKVTGTGKAAEPEAQEGDQVAALRAQNEDLQRRLEALEKGGGSTQLGPVPPRFSGNGPNGPTPVYSPRSGGMTV